MLGLIPWLVTSTGWSKRAVQIALGIVGAVLLIGLAILAWNLWLGHHDRGVIDTHETKVTAQLQTQARAADQTMTQRRDDLTARQTEERKEFDNATASLPKSGLTARQRVDACRELRRQGESQAILSRAGCVPAGG